MIIINQQVTNGMSAKGLATLFPEPMDQWIDCLVALLVIGIRWLLGKTVDKASGARAGF